MVRWRGFLLRRQFLFGSIDLGRLLSFLLLGSFSEEQEDNRSKNEDEADGADDDDGKLGRARECVPALA
jgi:hypothetical protein